MGSVFTSKIANNRDSYNYPFCFFSGFLCFWGFCINLKGNFSHCATYIDLQLNIGEKNEKISQEELSGFCHLFLYFGNSKFKISPRAQKKEKAVRVLDLKAVETANIESNTAGQS